jgi:hypothetical protein
VGTLVQRQLQPSTTKHKIYQRGPVLRTSRLMRPPEPRQGARSQTDTGTFFPYRRVIILASSFWRAHAYTKKKRTHLRTDATKPQRKYRHNRVSHRRRIPPL